MRSKSYHIDPVLEEFPGRVGYMLYLYVDDDCIWQQLVPTKDEATDIGESYLFGQFSP